MLRIKNSIISKAVKTKVSLAPLAGITDFVLRELIRENAPDALISTEMISSEALNQVNDPVIIKRTPEQSPIAYQISGHKPELMAKAAQILEPYADIIDINMGCPVNKVVKGGDGSALMKTPDLAVAIVKSVKAAVKCPVSVKFRLGYTVDSMNFVEYGQKMQEAGVELITLHARTRAQMYGGSADWNKIRELVNNVDIPVFANGDITSVEKAAECLEISGAAGVAIGRGALGDITLIGRIEEYFKTGKILPPPSLEEKIEALKKHLYSEIELRGENVGMKFVRKFYPYYISGIKNAAKYRSILVTSENLKEIEDVLNYILKEEHSMV